MQPHSCNGLEMVTINRGYGALNVLSQEGSNGIQLLYNALDIAILNMLKDKCVVQDKGGVPQNDMNIIKCVR